jgi:single-stranded-DNA-specific exonuclease
MIGLSSVWIERPVDNAAVARLVDEGFDPLLSKLLAQRGIASVDAAKRYLFPELTALKDPFSFLGMEAAVARIIQAAKRQETIGVFGDYDVDGVTSTALLSLFLKACGIRVATTIPDRLKEGYGLSSPGLLRLKEAGASLVVTVDCGITAHAEVEHASKLGMDVVIVDHHRVPVQMPRAVAVINPHQDNCTRNGQHFCAVGVVFNLIWALRRRLKEEGLLSNAQEPNLRRFLDLVAVGTVADVVPLIEDNRTFVHFGLRELKERARPGFKALLDVAGIGQKERLKASHLGFQLGPRINAAGRLDHADGALTLLTCTDEDEALILAQEIDAHNLARRELEKQIVAEAIREVDASREHQEARILVVANAHWHPGVVGIVASRLVERFAKPAIVIGENGKGSGRSIPALNLHDALVHVKTHLQGFGGHAHAVGVHIDLANLQAFRTALIDHVNTLLTEEDLVREHMYDCTLQPAQLGSDLLSHLEQMEPFGRGNPEPVFRLNGLRMGEVKELNGGHLRGQLAVPPFTQWVAFGMGEKRSLFEHPVDALVHVGLNVWNGNARLQLRIKDVRYPVSL